MTCRSIPTEKHHSTTPSSNDPDPPDTKRVAFVVEGMSKETLSEEHADEVTEQLREWLVARGYPAMDVYIDNGELY